MVRTSLRPLVPFKFRHQNVHLAANNLAVIYSKGTELSPAWAKALPRGLSPHRNNLNLAL